MFILMTFFNFKDIIIVFFYFIKMRFQFEKNILYYFFHYIDIRNQSNIENK